MTFQSGSFLPDGRYVLALVRFVGAPAAPDPASIYNGDEIILIKTDGATFPNGDPWKCITCGVPPQNAIGTSPALDYPQSFRDGKRALAGTNIIDCSPYGLADSQCTPERTHVYPIRWNTTADGSGSGGSIRELRLHPDNVHLGFSSMTFTHARLGQFGYLGRLEFNATPENGEPRAPRYELSHVTLLFREGMEDRVLTVDPQHPDQLRLNLQGKDVGEFRGFSGDGREAYYVGYPFEACNLDVFAIDLASGKVRRLTTHPEYVDPMDSSPDGKWLVIEDTRGSDRQMFLAAMRGLPPLTDLVTVSAVSSVRNNGDRRFFQPFLLDRYGDRGNYYGQQLNAGDGKPGSPSDPNWNAMADPRWSPDGASVVYWQAQVTSPACGGSNPLPCPPATEPGGRRFRIMLARFVNRKPVLVPAPTPISDTVPWGTPYAPGNRIPDRTVLPEGTFTLKGAILGSAKVTIRHTTDHSAVASVTVAYDNYSDERGVVFSGTESISETRSSPTTTSLDWHSNIVQSGKVKGTKVTGPEGFKLTIDVVKNKFQAMGTLATTIDGKPYHQPSNGN
ncbi:MAG: hypothetical protein ABI806_02340 [Candidatus Solibacter sp.]